MKASKIILMRLKNLISTLPSHQFFRLLNVEQLLTNLGNSGTILLQKVTEKHFSQLPLLNDMHYRFHLKLRCLSIRVRCLSISQGSSPPARTTFHPVRCLFHQSVTNHGYCNQILKVTTSLPGFFCGFFLF